AARLAHARSRSVEALEHLERAAAILPWDAQVLQMLAAACEELGEHPRAAAAYAALLLAWKRSPGAADADAIAKVQRKLDQAATRTERAQASESLTITHEPLPHPDHARAPAHAAVNETGPPSASPTLSSIAAVLMLTLGPRPPPT